MIRLAARVAGLLVFFAVIAIGCILLGLYLNSEIQPVVDKPIGALTIRDFGAVLGFGWLFFVGLAVLWFTAGQIAETVRDGLQDLRRKEEPIMTCPQCGEPAWGGREPRCPFCGWNNIYGDFP